MKEKELKKALLSLLPQEASPLLDVSEKPCIKHNKTVLRCTDNPLPYAAGSVKTICSFNGAVPLEELHRVLCTKGTLYAAVSRVKDIPVYRAKLKSLFDVNCFFVDENSIYFEAQKREVV